MPKLVKGLVIAGSIIVSLVFIHWLIFHPPVGRISYFVQANQEELLEIAQAQLRGESTESEYKGVQVQGVQADNTVVFYHSGRGLGPSTTYFGFYYSPEDGPSCFDCDAGMEEVGKDRWEWSYPGTDNGGCTSRIMPCWYFYALWY